MRRAGAWGLATLSLAVLLMVATMIQADKWHPVSLAGTLVFWSMIGGGVFELRRLVRRRRARALAGEAAALGLRPVTFESTIGPMHIRDAGQFPDTELVRRLGRSIRSAYSGTLAGLDMFVVDQAGCANSRCAGDCKRTIAYFRGTDALLEFELRATGLREALHKREWTSDNRVDLGMKGYRLRAGNVAAARAMFAPRVLRFFKENPGWSVECAGRWLAVYRWLHRVRPRAFGPFVDQTREIVKLFVVSG